MAWVDAGKYRAVAGIPVAPQHRLAAVSEAFVRESIAAGCRVLFFCADRRFIRALKTIPRLEFGLIPIGEQPEWNAASWEIASTHRRSVRQQCNRAKNKGVTIRRLAAEELAQAPTLSMVENVLRQWLDSRQMSSLSFLVDLQPFHFASERRYYLAEVGASVVGFLAAVPVYARRGWFFEDVIRVPDAPNGTTELLIHTAMRDAQSANDSWITLGLSPLAGIEQGDVQRPFLIRLLAAVRSHGDPLYRFQGLRDFKARFKPDEWTPQYIVQCPPGHTASALHAVLRAFAGRGLLSFAMDTVRRIMRRLPLRYWATIVFLLAGLLIPWTILLALADGARWFGDESIQNAWVAFDALLACSLAALGWLIRAGHPVAKPAALFLAGTTLTDFVLTAVQAVNLHQDVSGWQSLFVMAGMMGPLAATVFLVSLHLAAPFPRGTTPHARQSRQRREPR